MGQDYTQAMCRIVESYIAQRTGKRIRIVFNDAPKERQHLVMLREAYNWVQQQSKK